ncbi:serine-protein kinase ATM-like isoform X2 [Stegodyphus dumicola]|uniref:serine-protein kinase ATM-like isoform X2 n=1 Tax=Stegodyphus dumicola TaxID=202533 RepID=UPI0015AF2E8E|nr:serine-protein kinase ATM-like isoform X2 [Stegodyphus dumicola]
MNEFEIAKKLRDCLLQLVEGKATERKKQVENLKVYLTHPAYLQHLNKSSLKGRNASEAGIVYISWQKVFSKIKDYVEQECQRLKDRERSSETLSATVRENICKERRLCLSLFRCFTKALTISEQYEMAHPLMLHILAVLHEYYTELTFRNEYSNVLLKCILNDPFMCLKIPAEKFDDAIWIYCKIIKKFPRSNDRGISSQVLHDLLAVRYNMGHTDASKILSFFTHMFQTLKSEKASLFHENLLRCLLVVSKALGSDYHIRLCELGESILLPLLDLWKTRPSETCQELMLEFISLQLSLHHPKGAVKQENGARAADWQTWKNHLLRLYKVILVEVTELCETNKYSASKESILKPIFVFVAVEVCAQIFPGSVDCLDITQASTSYEVSQPAKKRRVEVCFRALTDDLTSSKIEPWLQVISSFLVNHSDIVSMQDAEHLLDILIDIHLSCNQLETKRWLLTCCQSFVQAFGSKDAGDCSEGGFQWQRLWELAVKSVALMHQCQEAGHKLLTALLFYKLAVPKAEFYTLYAPGSSNPVTSASLRSLKTFLEKYPASYTAHSMYYNNSVSSMGNGTFENQIMEWLFSRKNDDNSPFQVLSNDDMPTLEAFAEVAALLCLRNNGSHCSLEVSSEKLEKIQWIQLMEEELLLITFDMPFNHNMSNQGTTSFNSSPGQLLQPVWDKILNRFISATEGIFEEQISNFQNASLSTFLRYACLLFEMLQTFYFQGIIKEEHLQSNHFTSYLKKSLHAFIEISKKRENNLLSDETNQIKGLLQHILMVFKQHCQQTVPVQYPNNFIVTVANSVPVEMLTYLLSYSLENVNHNTSTLDVSNDFSEPEGNLNHSLRKNKYAFAEDDLEDEVDSFVPRMENKESVQLMDVKGLPNNVQQQLECLEILGEFSSLIDSDTYFDELASFPQNMIQQMLSFISRNDQGFRRVADVHLVLKSLRCILLNKQLADEVIDKVLSTLKLILNQLGKMQDLCQAVLELFPLLYPHIFKDSSNMSSNRVRSKFHMLHLLRVLCKRESEQKGSRFTSCLMTQNLLAIINMEPSSLWSSESSSSTSHDSCIATNSDSVAYAFIKFLNSPFISVRLLVAKNINVSVTGIIIDDIFESVCNEIFTYLQRENQSRASSENNEEEISNRIRTFLHFLGHIIVYFPCLEMESIYMMCKLVKIKKVDESLAAKVVQQISSILGYRSMRDLVESHLVNILHKWIKDKYSWKEFPFILLDVESIESFILDFFKFLVPVLFYYGDNESISELSNKLNLSLAEVIYACYPTIQARILSGCAVDYRRRDALKCRNFLNNYLPQELQEKVFPAKLDELVVSLLSLLKENGNAHLKLCETHIECISCQDFCSAVKNMMSDISCDGTFSSFLCQRVV